MPTLAERYNAADKKGRKKMSDALSNLTNRATLRCIMALRSRDWHEEAIGFRLNDIMSMISKKVLASPAIAEEGWIISPKNLTNAVVIGTQTAIELDVALLSSEGHDVA